MTSIPNTLTITINTSIPGNQTIKFKPNMLIQNISKDDNKIYFNPLVPLNQSIINNLPKNIRVLEFFNQGLFNSLINLHGNKKGTLPTLEEARNKGIIDNNIKITLNTLFPVGTVIYVNKNAYSIVDTLWNNGSWKLDAKPVDLRNIQPEKIMNPFTYNQYVVEQFKKGQKELENINDTARFGPNYDKSTEAPKPPLQIEAPKPPLQIEAPKPPLQIQAPKPPLQIQAPKPPLQIQAPKPPLQIQAPKPPLQIQAPKPPLQIQAPKPPLQIEAPPISNIIPENENVEEIKDQPMTITIDLPLSKDSTAFLRKYFLNNDFYFMINQIYLNMNSYQKNIIQQIYSKTTGINIVPSAINLSRKAYDVSVIGDNKTSKGIRVVHNEGGGNCFFISIADAINYYNSTSKNKIIYNNYGIGNNLFTQKMLRTLVSNYVMQNLNNYISVSKVFSDNLNKIFKNELISLSKSNKIDNNQYMELVNKIYINNDNLMVKKPNSMPTDNSLNFYNPFTSFKLDEKSLIKNYFESNDYWADANTINIISNIFKINIITIVNKNGYLSIQNANLKLNDISNWNRYLFIYYNENIMHYELISFDFIENKIIKEPQIKIKKITNRIIIFDNELIKNFIFPPIYIIYLLFSTYYLSLDEVSRNKIIFFKPYLDSIMSSFNNIIDNTNNPNKIKFFSLFNKYFPNTYNKVNLNNPQIENQIQEFESEEPQKGGQSTFNPTFSRYNPYNPYNPYNQYNPYNPYNRPYSPYKYSTKEVPLLSKKESNLSYQIIIDLLLQKGDKLSPELSNEADCLKNLNEIKKSYANLTGKKYVLPPVYSLLYNKDKLNKTIKNDKQNVPKNKTIKNIK